MTELGTGTIYGLVDPRTDEVKYVGQTTRPIGVRLAGHLAAPAPRVRAWMEELAVEGRLPQIIPLREDVAAAELDAAERDEINAHAEQRDLLNVSGNQLGNAKRRKISREEAKRRKAEEEAMDRTWRQATWRQVADQIRAAVGGPLSPADVPVRTIPAAVWDAYVAYREADRFVSKAGGSFRLIPPGFNGATGGLVPPSAEVEEARSRRRAARMILDPYTRAYCRAFGAVDEGDRWGSNEGVFGRGEEVQQDQFRDPGDMARYLSFLPWAARALDPWAILAEEAGMDIKSSDFTEWVTDDLATREAVELYQRASPGWIGTPRQRWDRTVATYTLALGAAHIPGFVTPALLTSELQERLTELARDRQATREMCQLLHRIDPTALDAVYGRDALAESDEALDLPPGTSAKVVQQVYGGDSRDPNDRAAKMLQRHRGTFDTVAVPAYSGWTGPHVPGMRVAAASFLEAGLFSEAEQGEDDTLVNRVKRTWMPTTHGLREVEEAEEAMRRAATAATSD